MSTPNLEVAMDYAQRFGWRVLPVHQPDPAGKCSCGRPCNTIGKHPRIKGGAHAATTDPATLKRWFGQTWPNTNIGIATGAGSGIVVLDEDPRHGSDDTIAELERRHGQLPPTVEALTGGGGRHRLFRHPGQPIKNDQGGAMLGPGLDVRGDGGLIVVAPSIHQSGRRYEWELSSLPGEVEVARLPDWLLLLLLGTDRETEEDRDTEGHRDTEAIASVSPSLCLSVSDAINSTLPAAEGQRNRKLFEFARALKAVPTLANAPLHEIKPTVKAWHTAALPTIGTRAFDSTWAEFTYAWPRVRVPMGLNPVAQAIARADAAPLPPEAAGYDSPQVQRLVKLCLELQRGSGSDPFFLSCRTAGNVIGVDHDAANKMLVMLVADAVLVRARAGTARTAARYRFNTKGDK